MDQLQVGFYAVSHVFQFRVACSKVVWLRIRRQVLPASRKTEETDVIPLKLKGSVQMFNFERPMLYIFTMTTP